MNQMLYNRLIAAEGVDQREEEDRLQALFAQIERIIREVPGIEFHHLQPGQLGNYAQKLEWNAYLYVRAQDRVFPFRVAIEPGRHSQFRLKIHPDLEDPTDHTLLVNLRQVMALQMSANETCLRLNYWNHRKEEPVVARIRRQ